MSTGAPTGATPSATPTDQAGTTHDAGVVATLPPPDSTPATSSVPSATPAESTAPPEKPEAAAPDDDPVRAAISRLARDDGQGQPRDDKGRFASQSASATEAPAPVKPAQSPAKPPASAAATPPTPPKPAEVKPPDSPSGVDVDPYHGFDEREKGALKQRTRDRIEELHNRMAKAEKDLKEVQAKPAVPDQLDTLISENGLGDDAPFVPAEHLANLISSQAAVTRSLMTLDQGRIPDPRDVKTANEFFTRIDQIRGRLGLAPPPPSAPELLPFAGQLPADLQDLIDVYGLPEADVRLLAAARGRKAQRPANQQQTPPAASAPAAPIPQQQQPAQPSRQVGVDMNLLYGQRLMAELSREVRPEMVQAHYQVLLPIAAQITAQRFPTVTADRIPAVFDALPPQDRYSILMEAHKAHRANQTNASRPPVATPPPPATNQGPINGSAPRARASSNSGDPVADAIAYLSR